MLPRRTLIRLYGISKADVGMIAHVRVSVQPVVTERQVRKSKNFLRIVIGKEVSAVITNQYMDATKIHLVHSSRFLPPDRYNLLLGLSFWAMFTSEKTIITLTAIELVE